MIISVLIHSVYSGFIALALSLPPLLPTLRLPGNTLGLNHKTVFVDHRDKKCSKTHWFGSLVPPPHQAVKLIVSSSSLFGGFKQHHTMQMAIV